MAIAEFKVSDRGQMSLPAEARRRWNLDKGGTVEIADLGDSLLIVPAARLVDDGVRLDLMSLEALAAAEHLEAELCLAAADENPLLLTASRTRTTTVRLLA